MLVLLSFGLVLVATVLLVLGLLVGDGLELIYVSIGLSALAAIVLIVAVRVSKPRERAAAPGGPRPIPGRVEDRQPEYATAGGGGTPPPFSAPVTTSYGTMGGPPPTEQYGGYQPPEEQGEWLASDQDWTDYEGEEPGAPEPSDDVLFPIADYDELDSDEILPLLPQLYPEEYDLVEQRERAGQARPEILGALADLRAGAGGPAAPITVPSAPMDEAEEEWEADDEALLPGEEEEPEAPEELVPVGAPEPEPVEEAFLEDELVEDELAEEEEELGAEVPFPIEDYDRLTVSQVISLLGQLDREELALVREREAAGRNRGTILANIDRRLGRAAPSRRPRAATVAEAPAPAATAPRARRAPAKKAAKAAPAVKKTTARKAPARKAVPVTSVTGRKAAVKKAVGKRAAKAPAPVAPIKKAGRKAAPAKAVKKTAAVKSVKKAPAKKAGPRKAR